MKKAVFACGSPIVTETRRPLRSTVSANQDDPVKVATELVKQYSDRLITEINERVDMP